MLWREGARPVRPSRVTLPICQNNLHPYYLPYPYTLTHHISAARGPGNAPTAELRVLRCVLYDKTLVFFAGENAAPWPAARCLGLALPKMGMIFIFIFFYPGRFQPSGNQFPTHVWLDMEGGFYSGVGLNAA